jgi:hypothetical protein
MLKPARARDLVYVFSNGRLADKMKAFRHEEEFVGCKMCEEDPEEESDEEEEITDV